ncbi:MAG: putative O-methyltransferase [Rhodobacteraceae bacterium HLUCCA12]|nr:MAG: putative O-methyltransferase [Rhodobacteraceae bacterium HLUCCA12]
MIWGETDLSRDIFLGGKLSIWQPLRGYRAATDPVLLAAAVAARPGQSVLELGCGAGVAILALGRRVPDLHLTGLERQPDYAALAQRNAQENAVPVTVLVGDLDQMPDALRGRAFDHVLANPPYYPPRAPAALDPGRAAALREDTPLERWIDAALRRLKSGGWLTMIHLAERLPQILAGLDGRAGAISVRPLCPRAGRPAGRVLIRARKGARTPFRLLSPLVLHAGNTHIEDRDDFSDAAQAILREGRALAWD